MTDLRPLLPRTGFRRYPAMLKLEGFAGLSVRYIAASMIEAAQRLDLPLSLDINGTHLLAFPTATTEEIRKD